MGTFAGLDIDEYPGDEAIAKLAANSNVKFVGLYLAPAPAHEATDWMDRLSFITSQKLGTAPVFLGHQNVPPGAQLSQDPATAGTQGREDGMLAADLMAKAGYAPGSWVYLDREAPSSTPAERAYIVAWAAAVRMHQYAPGVYCSHICADAVSQWVPGARIWVYKVATIQKHPASQYGGTFPLPDPHAGGYSFAYLWQHEAEAEIDVAGLRLTVDLDVAVVADPSK
jgi:hypothetical protein